MSFNASIAGHASDEVQNKVKQLLKDIVNTAEHGITLAHFNGENLIVELVPEAPAAPTQAPVEEVPQPATENAGQDLDALK
jgi:hypothetical protein